MNQNTTIKLAGINTVAVVATYSNIEATAPEIAAKQANSALATPSPTTKQFKQVTDNHCSQ
jgi:hypothetical protein